MDGWMGEGRILILRSPTFKVFLFYGVSVYLFFFTFELSKLGDIVVEKGAERERELRVFIYVSLSLLIKKTGGVLQ